MTYKRTLVQNGIYLFVGIMWLKTVIRVEQILTEIYEWLEYQSRKASICSFLKTKLYFTMKILKTLLVILAITGCVYSVRLTSQTNNKNKFVSGKDFKWENRNILFSMKNHHQRYSAEAYKLPL